MHAIVLLKIFGIKVSFMSDCILLLITAVHACIHVAELYYDTGTLKLHVASDNTLRTVVYLMHSIVLITRG